MIPTRMIIYTKDVENITGRCRRTALRILARVRKANNKAPKDLVTIHEFCHEMKMTEEFVRRFIS